MNTPKSGMGASVAGGTPDLRRGQRLRGESRASVAQHLLARYEDGQSIRQICSETGYSIGRVRRLLEEAGVTFRGRGGATQRKPT